MKKNYSHLSAEERAVIMIEHGKGSSMRAIARLLGRSTSTVSRELARNLDALGRNAISARLRDRTGRSRRCGVGDRGAATFWRSRSRSDDAPHHYPELKVA
jgi:IS30 family transposase